ncbi:hypothetical protein JCM8097_001721 [Rhodosporidiobolus ruineniae]
MLSASLSVLALLAAGATAAPATADINPATGAPFGFGDALSKRANAVDTSLKGFGDPDWDYQGCYPVDLIWTSFTKHVYLGPIAQQNGEWCLQYGVQNGYTAMQIFTSPNLSGAMGCHFGTLLDSDKGKTLDGSVQCRNRCAGDPAFECGESSNGDVYIYNPKPKGPQFIQSYSSGSTKWTRSGCQSDLLYGTRALPNLLAQTANQTVEACLDACTSAGYTQCGVEYHGECWGGNALDKTSQALGDDSCNLLCADNALEYCGGNGGPSGAAFQLFTTPSKPVVSTTTTAAPIASPTPTFVKSYKTSGKKGKTFTRKGCQSDLLYGTRALPNLLAQTANQTVEACLEACATNKYSLCGVEYKGECWGANKLDSTSQALDDSACNLPCADNSLEYCGGTGGPSGSAFQLFSSA